MNERAYGQCVGRQDPLQGTIIEGQIGLDFGQGDDAHSEVGDVDEVGKAARSSRYFGGFWEALGDNTLTRRLVGAIEGQASLYC